METALLKSFATWARTALIREVTARVAGVLAPASKERVENESAVATLEHDITAAGGGDKGRDAVAEKVAYTWFNRIIALRFMDANGYTGIGVVSPQRGRAAGQPEVLADAKRGAIDPAVVTNKLAIETITALLDGTRRSDDAQGEAYALLLTEYCRHWNRSMPFMFEREGDYTELLIPANLLADDSVLARAASVLTEDVCLDVEVIGWLYQFYISERKDEVFAGFKKNKKAGAAEIPAATQLFTPHWIVRYLVENSLGRLWMLNRPSSRLVEQMEYYVAPIDGAADFLRVAGPEELTVIDPACGSGHMLTYAFDLLYAIYEEEGYAPVEIPGLVLANNLHGVEIDPRAGALAAFALTMKARAKQRSLFNREVELNVCVLGPIRFTAEEIDFLLTPGGDHQAESAFWNQFEHVDTLGSLIRADRDVTAHFARRCEQLDRDGDIFNANVMARAESVIEQSKYLANSYSVLVANPPYMGSNNMGGVLSEWLGEQYPLSKSDLMTAFMERAQAFCHPAGIWGMINLPSWMFLKSFDALREHLLNAATIDSLLHLGRGIFGSDFGSVAFTVSNSKPPEDHAGVYRRLFEAHVDVRPVDTIRKLFLDKSYGTYETSQSSFLALPGTPIAYWLSEQFLRVFSEFPRVTDVAFPKQGLATADDGRFLRFWYEVSDARLGRHFASRLEATQSGRKWFPFNKGGAFRRWFGNIEHVVNWGGDGHELRTTVDSTGKVKARPQNTDFYFRPAVTWSNVSSGAPAFRAVDQGVIFGHVGQSLFAEADTRAALLAILNSAYGLRVLEVLAPTIHYEVGSIAKVPVALDLGANHQLLVTRLVEIARNDWDTQETSLDFGRPDWFSDRAHSRLPDIIAGRFTQWRAVALETVDLEQQLNVLVSRAYHLDAEIAPFVGLDRVSLLNNPYFRFDNVSDNSRAEILFGESAVRDLVSYAVGCMFGRYSLDEPGLILADQNSSLQDYLDKVPSPSYFPDRDNVVPIVGGDWFEDDIVARFRAFLRATFGEQYFEENLRFVAESLGVNDIRDYFVKSFYKDHIQRYKKRPIYWLFSSPKGSFNALIYMHRYTPSTVSIVLNEYLREFKAKLEASRQHHERLVIGDGTPREKAAAEKEVDRLRKVLLELDEYEHDVLYPLATQQITIDLDDGALVNYLRFGNALASVPEIEKRRRDVEAWSWPRFPLTREVENE
jgi:hypothetical protein